MGVDEDAGARASNQLGLPSLWVAQGHRDAFQLCRRLMGETGDRVENASIRRP